MKKLILSRKGFDSKAGGGGSPILPDGRIVSFPIPGDGHGRPYAEIEWEPDSTLSALMKRLGIPDPGLAHHDPDLDPAALKRETGWRPMFGQSGGSGGHLVNEGVGPGDLFLFFGRFRRTKHAAGELKFFGEAMHLFWGYLLVDEVRDPLVDPPPGQWALAHPHYACTGAPWFTTNNRVFVAPPSGHRSGGVFRLFRDELLLTAPAPNKLMSRWRVPLAMHPHSVGSLMSNTSLNEWAVDDAHAYLQITGQRQEFVVGMSPEIEQWAETLIELGVSG